MKIYFLFFISFIEACLKINNLQPTTTLAPNSCRCEAIPLNSTTIHAYIQPSNPFYLVLSTATLFAPTVSIDECSVMMWCDGDYSLVVFDDTSLGKIFGAYPANGFCDAESQEWLVDTREGLGLTRFNQLYGICFIAPTTPSTTSSTVTTPSTPSTTRSSTTVSSTVTTPTTTSATTSITSPTSPSTTRLSSSTTVYSTVTTATTPSTTSQATTTTTVTSTTSICDCEYVALDRFTIRNYISPDNLFYNDLTSETVVLPTATNQSCSVTMTCPTGYSMLVFDRTNLGKLFPGASASGDCDSINNKWKVFTGQQTTFNQFYGICIVGDSENHSTTGTSSTVPTTTTSVSTSTTVPITFTTVPATSIVPSTTTVTNSTTTVPPTFTTVPITSTVASTTTVPTTTIMPNTTKRVLDNPKTLCRSKMIVFINRYTNETNIEKLVVKLRERHVHLELYVIDTPTGGLYTQPLYDLASRTNGVCTIINDFGRIIIVTYTRQFYAANPKVSGKGTMELAIPKLPKNDYILQIAVQDHLPLDQFRNLTLTWGNGMVPNPYNINQELFIKYYGVINVLNTQIKCNGTINRMTFNYNYVGAKAQVLQIRLSNYYLIPDSFPPFDN
ncbi:hypothetical protein CRE_23140 [Caenorhabditis remanei]|uniref:DUF7154 domain-containing protein n=1 Tax=Caenorhabditis remanei TaxID=31234 RepID=E3NFX0_CAERE|nr:hypothetical protein CRE_23140 [Caenorhabditis remanei]